MRNELGTRLGLGISSLVPHSSCLSGDEKPHFVIRFHPAESDVFHFSADELFFQRFQSLGKKYAFDVVVLVLDDAGVDASEDLFVWLEVFVEPRDFDKTGSVHVASNIGDAEASFFVGFVFAGEFEDFGVDEDEFGGVVVGLRVFSFDIVGVNQKQPDAQAHLRRSDANSFGVVHGFVHIFDEHREIGIVRLNRLCHSF